MFGYVTPYKDELKVRQFDVFKSYYCGLCQHIKKDYGQLPRLTLNYDMTTLGLLLDGLSPHKTYMQNRICMTHPGKKKQMIIGNQALSFAATMNVALVYYKLLDDVKDDQSLKSKIKASALEPYKSKFSKEVQPILKMIEKNLDTLYHMEIEKNFHSLDEISHPFSLIVANILKMYPYQFNEDSEQLREQLYQFGYALGKWIYVIDALDDLKKDMENHKFNPIFTLYGHEEQTYDDLLCQVKENISFTLMNCGYNCQSILRKLPLRRNRVILKNIIELGMMDQYTKVTASCNSCRHKKG